MFDHLPDVALSIRQPWAWAIVNAGKDVENRSWRTSRRGRIAIHAGKGMTRDEWVECSAFIRSIAGDDIAGRVPAIDELERGGIVGTAYIVDCVMTSPSPWFFGEFGILLSEVKPVPFIPARGELGFFKWKRGLE